MGMYWDFHPLLKQGYDELIRVTDRDERLLRQAREAMRAELREAFRLEKALGAKNSLLDESVLPATLSGAGFHTPKFRLQGSFSYHTHTTAIICPPQEVDMDDGMFLPVQFFSDERGRPVVGVDEYFGFVERVLERLAGRKGWRLNTSKDTCVRMQINSRLHVDLPLYAIRDDIYTTLVEDALSKSLITNKATYEDSFEINASVYSRIRDEDILLADREHGWRSSDPRKLETWFQDAIQLHGTNVRVTSRILKGYRDAQEKKSKLSSIAIMVGVVAAFEERPELADLKLCKVVREVAAFLSSYFGQSVDNPVFPGRSDCALCVGWSPDDRIAIQRLMSDLASALDSAGRARDQHFAHKRMKEALGKYMSDDISLIVASDALADSFAQTAATVQPAPPIKSWSSG